MIQLAGVFQVEFYQLSITVHKLGEHDSYSMKPFTIQCSRTKNMKLLFQEICNHFWLPTQKTILFIPTTYFNSYKQIFYSSLKQNDTIYTHSRQLKSDFYITAERTDGSHKKPSNTVEKDKKQEIKKISTSNLRIKTKNLGYAEISDSPRPPIQIGIVGLANLGNTCYLNSSLQCLFQIRQIREYFVKDPNMEDQTIQSNDKDDDKDKKRLIQSFSTLITKIWSGETAQTSPEKLRTVVCRIAPQFMGYKQHDAQEFLTFFLNGLHEELKNTNNQNNGNNNNHNRKTINDGREDISQKISSEEDIQKISEDCWNKFLTENQSVIADCFYGQIKSSLECPLCDHNSIVFDPFVYLSVPIPIEKQAGIVKGIKVVVFPFRSTPFCVFLQVESNRTFLCDLKEKIIELSPVPLEYENLFLTQAKQNLVQCGHTKDHGTIPELLSPNHNYYLYELERIDTQAEKDEKQYYEKMANSIPSALSSSSVLENFQNNNQGRRRTRSKSIGDPKSKHISFSMQQVLETPRTVMSKENRQSLRDLNPSCPPIISKEISIVRHRNYLETYVGFRDVICQFVARQFIQRSKKSQCGIIKFGYPILIKFSRYITFGELLAVVKEKINDCTKKKTSEKIKKDIYGNILNISKSTVANIREISPLSETEKKTGCSFSLRFVNQLGSFCGICDPSKQCRGCPLEDFSLRTLENGKFIAVDFHESAEFIPIKDLNENNLLSSDIKQQQKRFSASSSSSLQESSYIPISPSLSDSMEFDFDNINLLDCIQLYFKKEVLSESETWKCSSCKFQAQATKQLSFWRLPNILVIHLKRFSQIYKVCSFLYL